jgi:hypothetical protein
MEIDAAQERARNAAEKNSAVASMPGLDTVNILRRESKNISGLCSTLARLILKVKANNSDLSFEGMQVMR